MQVQPRLRRHLKYRIPHEKRKFRLHDVWDFVRDNLSRTVVILLGIGHFWPMRYMHSKDFEDQLLRSPSLQDRVICLNNTCPNNTVCSFVPPPLLVHTIGKSAGHSGRLLLILQPLHLNIRSKWNVVQ